MCSVISLMDNKTVILLNLAKCWLCISPIFHTILQDQLVLFWCTRIRGHKRGSFLCFVLFFRSKYLIQNRRAVIITRNDITILGTKLPTTGMQLRFLKMAYFAEQMDSHWKERIAKHIFIQNQQNLRLWAFSCFPYLHPISHPCNSSLYCTISWTTIWSPVMISKQLLTHI